jgi:hypothetical protein
MPQLHIHLFGSFRRVYADAPPGRHTWPRLQVLPTDPVPRCDAPQLEKKVESIYLFKGALAQDAEYTNTRG